MESNPQAFLKDQRASQVWAAVKERHHCRVCRFQQGISNLTPTIDKYAPLYFVRGDAAPMLIISGDRELELFGRYEENAYFVRMLRLNGHKKVTFYEVDGFDHGDMAQPAHLLLLKYMKKNNK